MSDSPSSESSILWLQELIAGDERVAQEFWEAYGPALNRMAENHLSPRVKQRVAPEEVVQSACRTFFRRAKEGQFELVERNELWRLLTAITLRKTQQHARFHSRQKRAVKRERSLDYRGGESRSAAPQPMASAPQPDEIAAFEEELAVLLAGLSDEEAQFVQLRLDGCTQQEIAGELGCSERTVRRILGRVQDHYRSLLERENSVTDGERDR